MPRLTFGNEVTHTPVKAVTVSSTSVYAPKPGVAPYQLFTQGGAPVTEFFLRNEATGNFDNEVSVLNSLADGFPPVFQVELPTWQPLFDSAGKALLPWEGRPIGGGSLPEDATNGQTVQYDAGTDTWQAVNFPTGGTAGAGLPTNATEGQIAVFDADTDTWVAANPTTLSTAALNAAIQTWVVNNLNYLRSIGVMIGVSYDAGDPIPDSDAGDYEWEIGGTIDGGEPDPEDPEAFTITNLGADDEPAGTGFTTPSFTIPAGTKRLLFTVMSMRPATGTTPAAGPTGLPTGVATTWQILRSVPTANGFSTITTYQGSGTLTNGTVTVPFASHPSFGYRLDAIAGPNPTIVQHNGFTETDAPRVPLTGANAANAVVGYVIQQSNSHALNPAAGFAELGPQIAVTGVPADGVPASKHAAVRSYVGRTPVGWQDTNASAKAMIAVEIRPGTA
jgi:hypothetical protein